MAEAEWLEVGRIGSPFGVKGWVHVESFTDPQERLLKIRAWHLRCRPDEALARPVQVLEGREHTSGMVARLDGVEDRNAAALLQGCGVWVERRALPALKARQYYQADLMGLEVLNRQGERLGLVGHFAPTPAGTMMVVHGVGRDVWIPATPQYLSKVDLSVGEIYVDWPAELG